MRCTAQPTTALALGLEANETNGTNSLLFSLPIDMQMEDYKRELVIFQMVIKSRAARRNLSEFIIH